MTYKLPQPDGANTFGADFTPAQMYASYDFGRVNGLKEALRACQTVNAMTGDSAACVEAIASAIRALKEKT